MGKSCCDLDLGPIVPNVDLSKIFSYILISYVAFEFQDPKSKHSQDILFTDTQKHRKTDTQEYYIVAMMTSQL